MENMDISELVRLYETSKIDEDELTVAQMEALIDYYKRQTIELNEETLRITEDIKAVIMDIPIKAISPDMRGEMKEVLGAEFIFSEEIEWKKKAYFLVLSANDHIVCYHEIVVLWSLLDLIEYMIDEYSATAHAKVLDFSANELLEGCVYKVENNNGAVNTKYRIRLIHDRNLPSLFRLLENITLEDGSSLRELFFNAASKDDIEDIIDYYNESQDNVW